MVGRRRCACHDRTTLFFRLSRARTAERREECVMTAKPSVPLLVILWTFGIHAGASADAPAFIEHKTTSFKVGLPAGWVVKPIAVSNDGTRGFYAAFSPKKNGKAYFMVRSMRATDSLKQRWYNF